MEKKNFFLRKEKQEILNDWNMYDLGSVFRVFYGKSKPKEPGNIPVFGSQGIYAYTNRSLIQKPALIIGRKGNAGSVYYVNTPCFISDTAFFVVPKEEFKSRVYLKFVYYFLLLNKPKGDYAKTTLPSLNRKHLEGFKIPLPPLSEQKAIAKVLKDFDDLIEVVEKQIENFERIKKGLMEKYFSEGVFEHKEFKETAVGRIPKEWEVVEIRRIGRVVTGKTPPTNNKDYWNGNIQFITPGNIADSPYVFKTERHVSCNWAKQKNLLLPSKTVLIVCIGSTIGKIALTIGDSVTNQQINALLPYDNVDPICLYYILTFHSTRLKYLSGIAAVPIIKKSLFESFKIPLPPLPEQKEIARRLKAVDDLIETKRKEKERIERAKKKTMELLLTGKVRVKSE